MPDLVFQAVCLLIQSLVSVTQGGPIMQHVLLLQCHMPCKLMHGGFWGWNYRFQMCTQAATKNARTHIPHPSLLMQNASSPEPHTQFSTLLWASAVNSPARGGNRQHLSPASRWRNASHTAVGVTARSRARLHNTQIPFSVKFGEKKHRRSKFPLALLYAVFVPFFEEGICWCPKATKHLNVQRRRQLPMSAGVTTRWGRRVSAGHYNTLITSPKDDVMCYLWNLWMSSCKTYFLWLSVSHLCCRATAPPCGRWRAQVA